ncbi:hypothetical protein HU200_058804 [Digitaria exilis]|uniref:Uncharacterized protein n=1 Tax=Digitaria exilis TaxID=1010633 RepID=A0A835AIX6_9POAL|nr:hypothetical protein HU200_058804 [Digitaria exilis]
MDVGGSGGGLGGGIISSPVTEDDKFARRRSRRVSFADTTAVHVFDRDEDFETPPEEREPGSAPTSSGRSSAEREDGDDTDEGFRRPPVIFLPDVDSSSPGSAAGSMASTDDDESFFGPVSTSFIQIERPPDSGMSEDDNHDITMDSRTFSLHFRNIAPPDDCTANSAASLMTPNMASEGPLKEMNSGRTLSRDRTDMSLLTGKGPLKELIVSDSGRTLSTDRTDMSLLSGNPRCYDYGKLSPTLCSMVRKVKGDQQTESPNSSIADVSLDRVLTLSASGEENREANLCTGNGISSDELPTINSVGHISMSHPVSTSTRLIQEDDEIIIDGHENSKNCNHVHMTADPSVNNTVESPTKLSPAYQSFMNNVDVQSHPLHQSLMKDQPFSPNCTARVSSMCNVDLEPHLLDQPSGPNNITDASWSSAAPDILIMDNGRYQQNEVMDTETILHTPRTVGQTLQVPQGSISSLRSKRQKLFCSTPISTCNVASQESCSLGSEFSEHTMRISALKNALKTKLQESPAASQLPLAEQSSLMIEGKQNGPHDNGKLENVDWNKVLCSISKATEQILSASTSKLNLQQLDMLSDKLDEVHIARKYRRFSTAVRIKDYSGDRQQRLEEARSLHEKLFYAKAKLQINNMKLTKLKKKAQLYQDGIEECRILKSKILGASQMKDACLPGATSVSATDKQEELPILIEKRLELNNIQQKVENLRSSLACFRNIECDISCDSIMKHAEEQLNIRNLCHFIHQQAGLCELKDMVKKRNRRDLILNYHNLLFQRVILNTSDMPSIFVNNSLNGTKIGQETSLLLGNLIDVLEEMKLAKMELINFTSVCFVLESKTCQLSLHLCFMSFKSGKKIAFQIDMTDLNRSVYPSDPSELAIKICEAQTTLSQPNIEETMASIKNLQPGHTVILRLCRMVSQLIHSLPV